MNNVVTDMYPQETTGTPSQGFNHYNQNSNIRSSCGPQVHAVSIAADWPGACSIGDFDFDFLTESSSYNHEDMKSLRQSSGMHTSQPLLPPAMAHAHEGFAPINSWPFLERPVPSPPQSPTWSFSSSSSPSSYNGPSSIRSRSSTASNYSYDASVPPISLTPPQTFPTTLTTSLPSNIPSPTTMYPNPINQYDVTTEENCEDALLALLYGIIPQPGPQPAERTNLAAAFTQPSQCMQRNLLDNVLSSPWLVLHVPEPKDDKNRSILLGFLAHEGTGGTFRCLFDGCNKSLDRQDRALGHIRMHIGHRPHACSGACGVSDCQERFYCQSYLRSHIKRQKAECGRCPQFFFRQHLRKHRLRCQGMQNQAQIMPQHGNAPAQTRSMCSVDNTFCG